MRRSPWEPASSNFIRAQLNRMFDVHISGELSPINPGWEKIARSVGRDDYIRNELPLWEALLGPSLHNALLEEGEYFLTPPFASHVPFARSTTPSSFAVATDRRLLIWETPEGEEGPVLTCKIRLSDLRGYDYGDLFSRLVIKLSSGDERVYELEYAPETRLLRWILLGMDPAQTPPRTFDVLDTGLIAATAALRISAVALIPAVVLFFAGIGLLSALWILLSYPVAGFVGGTVFAISKKLAVWKTHNLPSLFLGSFAGNLAYWPLTVRVVMPGEFGPAGVAVTIVITTVLLAFLVYGVLKFRRIID